MASTQKTKSKAMESIIGQTVGNTLVCGKKVSNMASASTLAVKETKNMDKWWKANVSNGWMILRLSLLLSMCLQVGRKALIRLRRF